MPNWSDPARVGDLVALAAGAALPLAFAPAHLFPLAVLSPALLFFLWLDASPGSAFRRGYLFGLGAFGTGVSWVYVAIHDFGYTGAPIAALLTLLFVAAIAIYPALAGLAAAWLRRRFAFSGAAHAVLVLPAVWVLFEWIRGRFLTGFPWLNLGYSQIDAPLAGLAPVAGVYGVSWGAALTAGVAVLLLRGSGKRLSAVAVVGVLVLWSASWALKTVDWTRPRGEPIRVDLVQGNLPQITKWDPDQIQRRLELYAEQTLPRIGQSDLVIWPENSLTVFYHELADSYFAWIEEKLDGSGTELLVGLPVMDLDSGEYYSSMMRFGPERQVYHKRHLVPFGEFVPLEGLLRGLIGFFDLPMSSFSRGASDQNLLSVAGERAAISICYEDAFGEEVIDGLPEATLLINGSNNAWYGDSLAPHQHLQISRMRAAETGRSLVRATTTGISALVDSKGSVYAASPQFETDVLSGRVQPMEGATPYVIWGNWPVVGLMLATVLGVCLWGRTRQTVAREEAVELP